MWGVEIFPIPLRWPLAYTTACITVQAVIDIKQSVISTHRTTANDHSRGALVLVYIGAHGPVSWID